MVVSLPKKKMRAEAMITNPRDLDKIAPYPKPIDQLHEVVRPFEVGFISKAQYPLWLPMLSLATPSYSPPSLCARVVRPGIVTGGVSLKCRQLPATSPQGVVGCGSRAGRNTAAGRGTANKGCRLQGRPLTGAAAGRGSAHRVGARGGVAYGGDVVRARIVRARAAAAYVTAGTM
ncbi:hypothetical protein B296_00007856 [Ensete ventricosum]|uniref:Uncharacterized protein n=1 Tax=Ensete ventricosum TaxID=4639 RepID=A0A426YDU7_ENSVE|nr:hypothetical protein B296_00007856 [Ensete ventricosum]